MIWGGVLMESELEKHSAEARLAAIVGSTDDAIIGKTLDGIVTSWNLGAERLFGYAAAEMIGESIALLLPPGNEAEEARILARLRRGETDHFDGVRRKKNGELVEVSVTSSPVVDASGKLVGASKVARDITARKCAERELARAKETAEAVSRELESFSYSVAHDLRAPPSISPPSFARPRIAFRRPSPIGRSIGRSKTASARESIRRSRGISSKT
ncbi:MAG: PAS domain-containing protein [Polyangiaceae bacterium]